VLLAADGFEGLIALKQSLPDIIISDLSMPNMNGFEFLSVVRRRFPVIPVIVISGEFCSKTVPESVLADAFLPKVSTKRKPYSQESLNYFERFRRARASANLIKRLSG